MALETEFYAFYDLLVMDIELAPTLNLPYTVEEAWKITRKVDKHVEQVYEYPDGWLF